MNILATSWIRPGWDHQKGGGGVLIIHCSTTYSGQDMQAI